MKIQLYLNNRLCEPKAWQSSKLKIIITILIIICLNSSPLLANEEQTKADTMAEIQQMKESIKILSQNLEAMQKNERKY